MNTSINPLFLHGLSQNMQWFLKYFYQEILESHLIEAQLIVIAIKNADKDLFIDSVLDYMEVTG